PFKYAYEKEIVMYAYLHRLDYFSTECTYSPNAYRGYAREFLKGLERVRPSAILDIIHSGEAMHVAADVQLPSLDRCERCGYISSNSVCKACVLLEGLEKGIPKLGISRINKLAQDQEACPPDRREQAVDVVHFEKLREEALEMRPAVAGLSYVAYFDYKRRNDRQFRRKLQRDRKKAEKTAQKVSSLSLDDINDQALELLNIVTKEKLPDSAEDKEQFFLAQVSRGETLCSAGPAGYTEAACRFYQALMVYPNPVELVMIYSKTTPDEVFKLVMAMMAQEVRQKQSRYFDAFPPEDKNVSIRDKNKLGDKSQGKPKKADKESEQQKEVVTPNRGLFATKGFAAGEVIYEEDAVVSTLLPCAQNGQFCYHCLKHIPAAEAPTEAVQDEPESAEKQVEDVDEVKAEEAEEEKIEETEEKVEETEEK
ncbi:mitochondrial import receptor subunit tom20, partial [Coemansia sp. RSA 1836]